MRILDVIHSITVTNMSKECYQQVDLLVGVECNIVQNEI